jgi:hypothetical protein
VNAKTHGPSENRHEKYGNANLTMEGLNE